VGHQLQLAGLAQVWALQLLAAPLLMLAALALGLALLLLGVLAQVLVQSQEWNLVRGQTPVLVLGQALVLVLVRQQLLALVLALHQLQAQAQEQPLLLVVAPPQVLAQALVLVRQLLPALVLVLHQSQVQAQEQPLLPVLAPPRVLVQAQEWGQLLVGAQQQQAVAAPAPEEAGVQLLAVVLAQSLERQLVPIQQVVHPAVECGCGCRELACMLREQQGSRGTTRKVAAPAPTA
jgi:hypothetical protein